MGRVRDTEPGATMMWSYVISVDGPSIGWIVTVLVLSGLATAQGRPGGAVVVALAGLAPILLNPFRASDWPLAAGAPMLGIRTLLGLEPKGEVLTSNPKPVLPAWFGTLTVEGIRGRWGRTTVVAIGPRMVEVGNATGGAGPVGSLRITLKVSFPSPSGSSTMGMLIV